jgi:hypothetical protein
MMGKKKKGYCPNQPNGSLMVAGRRGGEGMVRFGGKLQVSPSPGG